MLETSQYVQPLEDWIGAISQNSYLQLGLPKEETMFENRISLTPEAVGILVHNGFKIYIEKDAGIKSGFRNETYVEYGAIIADKEQVLASPIILKTAPLLEEEVQLIQPEALVISPIHYAMTKKETIAAMIEKKLKAISYEKFCDKNGALPIVKSMSEIAGSASILIAASYLNCFNHGPGILLGGITGIPPTKIIIIGAGTVGEFAARSALALGASVKVFDNDISRLKRLENNIGQRLWTSTLEPNILSKQLKNADIAIGALHSYHGKTPLIVTAEMVKRMRAGSVIIDIAIDRGGVFETSRLTNHHEPTFIEHNVVHYAVPNIPSAYSRTASGAISNILCSFLIKLGLEGNVEDLIKISPFYSKGFYLYRGLVCDTFIHRKFGYPLTSFNNIFT
ncbi:MAG: alanine dehydrogenase [Sediminibacterium sp.]|nr:alanine dehydrogenase [Sediminibacterium sp.]